MPNVLQRAIWSISSQTPQFRGKQRLVKAISRTKTQGISRIRREDIFWMLRAYDLNEFYIATNANHSAVLSERLSDVIASQSASVLWDVGANVGGISLPLLHHFPNLRSVMFEPSGDVAGRLISNLQANPGLQGRAIVAQFALGESQGLTNFYVGSEPSNSGIAGLGESANRVAFPVKVQCYDGDSLIESGEIPAPDVIKMDVEGFELEALKGLTRTLSNRGPVVVFEHSVYRLKERRMALDTVPKLLESLGYKIFSIENLSQVSLLRLNRDCDLIAVRSW